MSFDEPAGSGGAASIAFVAALGIECHSLRGQRAAAWNVVQSGPGGARAAAAAARAVDAGASVLISWGLAGGLDARLGAGALVVPRRVVEQGTQPLPVDASWHARFAALADEFVLDHGDLLTVPAALESPAAKRAAAAATGAVAVDMESAAIAAVAARARVPFVALRVVVDSVQDSLPAHAEQWIDERGERRLTAVLRAVATPRDWRALLTLANRYRAASAVLERLARALASRQLAGDGFIFRVDAENKSVPF
jgi:adenosylhomocysteine nucleosidase